MSDLSLARRLERAEGHGNVRCVEARARVTPALGATWLDVGGAWAMFDGPASMLTQSFGLGCFESPTDDAFDRLEHFFRSRGAPVLLEVSPVTGPAVLSALVRHGYRPTEQTSVLFQPIVEVSPRTVEARLTARPATADETTRWADLSARGWSELPETQALLRDFGQVLATRADAANFFAEWEGEPIASASLSWHGGVAVLAGASTLPAARGRGAQRALLAARLACAADKGCDLAVMGAEPGSTSQRNAERLGFRIAYTRTKWALP